MHVRAHHVFNLASILITFTFTAAASAQSVPFDSASSPAVVLSWTMPLDGSRSVDALSFSTENTTRNRVTVELHAVSSDGINSAEVVPARVTLEPNSTTPYTLRVADLAVKASDWSVHTSVMARYTGPDGLARQSGLEPVWIRHSADLQLATVRSADFESRARPIDMLPLDPTGPASLPGSGGITMGRTIFGSGRGTPPRLIAEQKQLYKGNSALLAPNQYTFCFRMPYVYFDQNLGEDVLADNNSGLEGSTPARFMWFQIESADAPVNDFLDAEGCSQPITLNDGIIRAFVSPVSRHPTTGTTFLIKNLPSSTEFVWYGRELSIAEGGRVDLPMTGFSSASNVGVAAAAALYIHPDAFGALDIDVFADENCPIPTNVPNPEDWVGAACRSGTRTFFGNNRRGVSHTFFKTVVLHELGHHAQGRWIGDLDNNYEQTPGLEESCTCAKVESSNSVHCLQSRHFTSAAQVEGWGHFFASDVLNRGFEDNCTFAYYKEFREDDGSVTPPPVVKSCFTQVRWMENHCNTDSAGQGTEYDWLGFYWNVKNKTANAFSYSELGDVYQLACGGGLCQRTDPVPFATLQGAANALYGEGSAKASHWAAKGMEYGVQH